MIKKNKVRHILGISGGKDSSALAVYMRGKVPEMEYFFCDTGAELPETYDYLAQLEKFLGKPIARLNPVKNFDWWLAYLDNFLPSKLARWCTLHLKLRPIEQFIGNDKAFSYVGIRADEDNRKGYQSPNGNIQTVFPFKEDGITRPEVFKILEEAGLGLPEYYKWRTRSGCYFCFFQRKMEWVGLYENHPELFEKAKTYEKFDNMTGKRFTWAEGESLEELVRSERTTEIKAKHKALEEKERFLNKNKPLYEILENSLDMEDDTEPCLICNL